MIEKLKPNEDKIFRTESGEMMVVPALNVPQCISDKINELVDAVNAIQKEREAERFEIQEWIGILEAVRKSVNIHEKQIDELQMKVEPEKTHAPDMYNNDPFGPHPKGQYSDPYAEQRKWIGKVCRFWNDDESLEDSTYGELVNIFDAPHEDCPFQCGYGEWYEHCEPVKPDDDIIYKGGKDE